MKHTIARALNALRSRFGGGTPAATGEAPPTADQPAGVTPTDTAR